jgi:hypothetical protein
VNHLRMLKKLIVSPDGKIIAEVKSMAIASGNPQSHISQSVSIETSGCQVSSVSISSSSNEHPNSGK